MKAKLYFMYNKIYQMAKYVKCMIDIELYFVYIFFNRKSKFLDSRSNGLTTVVEVARKSTDYTRTIGAHAVFFVANAKQSGPLLRSVILAAKKTT